MKLSQTRAVRRAADPLVLISMFVLTFALPSVALAWGSIGHRVVGQVADKKLEPKARAAVGKVMGNSSLGSVANWMDQVRGEPIGIKMKPWHFQSVDLCTAAVAPCPGDDCASRRIALAIDTLKAASNKRSKSQKEKADELKALRVLVHVVGDIHQPLHTAENGDFGGNSVRLANRTCIDFETNKPVRCKLHSYWDNNLVKAAMGSRSERNFVLALSEMKVPIEGSADAWIKESNALAKAKVHTYQGFSCKAGQNTGTLGANYDKEAIPVVNEQLAKAGQRLAAILNDIYK